MSINPVSTYVNPKTETPVAQANPVGNEQSRLAFGNILSASLNDSKLSAKIAEKMQVTDIAEMLHLEMLHNSLSLGDLPAERSQLGNNRALNQYLASLAGQEQNQVVDAQPVAEAQQGLPEASAVSSTTPSDKASSLDGIIRKASQRFGVEESLIKAVIKAESNFNPQAVSSAGASGLMQLMPATARGLGVKDSFDPEQNVMGGTRFLKDMLNRYDGNLNAALAAYNWGPGNVDKGGTFLPRETRAYLVKVKEYYAEFAG
jgi:soluble lytic murein transglycosylase-like protein